MGFTYGNPATHVFWAVRFELQDTDEKAPLLQDEEVEWAIVREATVSPTAASSTATENEVLRSAARCMEVLARKFRAQADTVFGSLRTDYTKQAKGYDDQAKELRNRAAGGNAPWSGGLSESEREKRESETDAIPPGFTRKQFDIPYKGPASLPFPSASITEEQK